jgi:hypothetical protein
LVADAVTVEPVSTPKIPANREINSEIPKIRPITDLGVQSPSNFKRCFEIPYATEQGTISAEQGILFQEQGIFFIKSEIING